MDSIEGRVAQLATLQDLILYAIFCTICTVMIMAGTYTGNSDIYDKIGQEMKTLNKTILAAVTSWRWAVEAFLRLAAARIKDEDEYVGKHRPEIVAARPKLIWVPA